MRKALYLLVLAVVLIAGCSSGGTTQMKNNELLRISGVTVTPGTVVAPDEIITIRMKLDNIGQEELNFVWKNCIITPTKNTCTSKDIPLATTSTPCTDEFCKTAGIGTKDNTYGTLANILYDHCGDLYKPQSFTAITEGFESESKGTQLILKPSRSALLEWTLKAPDEDKIAKMQHECNFKFQINYQARAETYTYIYFANPDEKNQRTYTNKDMNLRGENVANFGPVYINFETAQDQPIKGKKSDTDITSTWTLYSTVRNAGDGIGKIKDNSFKIQLPNPDKFNPTASSCNDFSDRTTQPGFIIHEKPENTDDSRLKLYSKASSRFSCTLPAPKVDVLEPYRFISSADYIYTIDKELKILTVPKR